MSQELKTRWVFEEEMFDESTPEMIEAVKALGLPIGMIKYAPFGGALAYPIAKSNIEEPVVFRGSLNLGDRIAKETKWFPGSFCDLKQFECTNYYTKLGKYLFNDFYTMFPFGELKRKKFVEKLFRDWSYVDCIFARPNSGAKSFNGGLLYKESFDRNLEQLSLYDPSDNELVVVSTPKKILAEWRVVIVDGAAVASSQYRVNGNKSVSEGADADILGLAEEIAATWSPERAFVADIGMDYGHGYKLIELNSFSCSGLYACNKEKIVRAVSELSQKIWNEVYA